MIVVDRLHWSHRINHDHGTAGVRYPARAVAVPGICPFGSFNSEAARPGKPFATFTGKVGARA